jgi:hypothetical protein
MAGAAITGPLLLSVKAYADKYKETEPVAMRLVKAQQDLAVAGERVGRVLATEIVPMMEKAADVAAKIAAFVEANPGVAKAALNIGAILTIGGGLITAAAQIAGTIATIQGLGAAGGAAGAAGGAAGKLGNVTLYAAAVVLGAGLGQELGNAINRATGAGEYDAGLSARQLASGNLGAVALGLRELGIISDESAKKFNQGVLAFFGFGEAATEAGTGAAKTATETQQLAAAVQTLGANATTASRELSSVNLRAIPTLLSDLEKQIGDLQSGIAEKLAQRAAQRQSIIDQAAQAEQQAARDNAAALAQIERRRQQAVTTAADQRDALGIDRANEAAEAERAEQNESYQAQRNAAQKSLQLQLKQFDAETRLQVEADRRKLIELQAARQAELALIEQFEAQKLLIFQNFLAKYQALGDGLGSGGGSGMGFERYPAPSPTPRMGEFGGQQLINIKMAAGQTLAQVRREIGASQRNFVRSFESALRAV